MSDIVERLRDPSGRWLVLRTMYEAADEIDRLRAALCDLIERWPTERGYDGAIQRARGVLEYKDEHLARDVKCSCGWIGWTGQLIAKDKLQCPKCNRALEGKE